MEARIIDENALVEFTSFLRKCKLPFEDIKLDGNLFISYHDNTGKMVGTGGLEFYSDYSLLRSVAVAESQRGKSLGKEIVNDLLVRASQRPTKTVFLLTETAPNFFSRLDFEKIERDAVPVEIKQSSEFTTVCPVSALCMAREL